MKKYVIANWKALPNSWAEAEGILDFLSENISSAGDEVSLVICPPFVYLEEVAKVFANTSLGSRAQLGVQDLTKESTAQTLNSINVRYVIIGHSDRRWKLGESNEVVNNKLKLALQYELTPIVCVGEKSREGDFQKFIKDQVEATFDGLTAAELEKCFIAYEPVWAISTNPGARPDTPDETRKALDVIRPLISNSLILYGGSVNKNNSKDFLSMPEISGVLVGGASVRKEEFVEILRLAG